MLTRAAAVCIAGAGTKRGLSSASILVALGCPGPLRRLGMKDEGLASVAPRCSALAAGGKAWDIGRGMLPPSPEARAFSKVFLQPESCLGVVSHPQPSTDHESSSVVLPSTSPLSTHFTRRWSTETHGCSAGSVPAWVPHRDTLLGDLF